MVADYYRADTEDGDHIEDPSEDSLFMLLTDLDATGNTYLTVTPPDDTATWYVSVARCDDGGYEVEYRDPHRREHEVIVHADAGRVALDLTVWLADRDHPGG
ncbi:hypothetical protein [Longispora urticae]